MRCCDSLSVQFVTYSINVCGTYCKVLNPLFPYVHSVLQYYFKFHFWRSFYIYGQLVEYHSSKKGGSSSNYMYFNWLIGKDQKYLNLLYKKINACATTLINILQTFIHFFEVLRSIAFTLYIIIDGMSIVKLKQNPLNLKSKYHTK